MTEKNKDKPNASQTDEKKPTKKGYSESSFTVLTKDNIKIYNPNSVSTKKRIISS